VGFESIEEWLCEAMSLYNNELTVVTLSSSDSIQQWFYPTMALSSNDYTKMSQQQYIKQSGP
jgi:hypothetical protein